MFGNDVHGYLGKIEVGADARGGCDASLLEDIADHEHGHVTGGAFAHLKIAGKVYEDFIDAIDMDVIGGYITQVDGVDQAAHLHVVGHLGWGGDVSQGYAWVRQHLGVICLRLAQLHAGGVETAFPVDLTYALHHLKEPGAAAYAVCLE